MADGYAWMKKGLPENTRLVKIGEASKILGVSIDTLRRWEKAGKVGLAKRDWRGWRVYDKNDFKKLKTFKEMIVYYGEDKNDTKT